LTNQKNFEIATGPTELNLLASFGREKKVPFTVEEIGIKTPRKEIWTAIISKLEIINNDLRKKGTWEIRAEIIKKNINRKEYPVKNNFFEGYYSVKQKTGKVKLEILK